MSTMVDINDWIDDAYVVDPFGDQWVTYAKEWFKKFLVKAGDKDLKWLLANPLFAQYKGNTVRITGASRLGDVWVTASLKQTNGYQHRVCITELSHFFNCE